MKICTLDTLECNCW